MTLESAPVLRSKVSPAGDQPTQANGALLELAFVTAGTAVVVTISESSAPPWSLPSNCNASQLSMPSLSDQAVGSSDAASTHGPAVAQVADAASPRDFAESSPETKFSAARSTAWKQVMGIRAKASGTSSHSPNNTGSIAEYFSEPPGHTRRGFGTLAPLASMTTSGQPRPYEYSSEPTRLSAARSSEGIAFACLDPATGLHTR
mmetsp:Transcript_63052/g.146837  ORF Transcript_63052/g.146837 Transcript_63052/m.146837 type:complete len:204 (+) Transcript_63052:496-1107(+)